MFEIGMEFKRNNITYTVLDLISLNNDNYILFSAEKEKMDFQYYKLIENGNNIDLDIVEDPYTIALLDEKVKGEKNE